MKRRSVSFIIFLFLILNLSFVSSSMFIVDLQASTNVKIVDPIEENGGIPVNIQDQTSPLIIAYMSNEEASTTLSSSDLQIGNETFNVVDSTNFSVGCYLSIFSVPDNRFYLASVLGIVGNTIEVDTPLDFAFPSGSFVTCGDRNLNVDGSGTPVIYGLRNTEEAIGSSFDITRIIITCLGDSAVDLATFCDIDGGIEKGIVFRKKDGIYRNIFNAKTNGELKTLMFDFDIEAANNPAQGQDGFTGRMTFGGQSKMGAVIRLDPGEDIQMIIQDDLSSLQGLWVVAEGHTVTD